MADADGQTAVTEWDEKGNPVKPQAAGATEWDEKGNAIGPPKQTEVQAVAAAPNPVKQAHAAGEKPLREAAYGTPEAQAEEKEMLDKGDLFGLSTALGIGSRKLERKRDEAEVSALGHPKPGYAAYTPAAGYDLAARTARMASGLSSPKSILGGIGLAVAPEVAGSAMVGEGLYHGIKATPEAVKGNPEAAEEALSGYSEAAGGGAATLASPTVAARMNPEARAARSLVKSTKEIKEAAPPSRQEINYDAQLERAKPYLAEEQRNAPVKSVREAHEVANSAVKGIEDKIGGYIDQLPETDRVSGQEILDRATAKLNDPNSPRTPSERAAGMKALEEFLTEEMPPMEEGGEPTREAKDLSVKEADRLRWRFNRDMDTEMGMTEADRSDVRASNPNFAAKEAATEALRDAVYDKLEQAGVPGVREIRGDEGAVTQMRDAFRRNINRAEKSNAPSAMRRLGVFGPVGLGLLGETLSRHFGAPPGVSTALGIGSAGLYEYMRGRMQPNPLMERGFGRLGRSGLAPNYPTMPIQGEVVPKARAAQAAPPIAREVHPEYPQLTEYAGREPGAPPPVTVGAEEATGRPADERVLARGGGIRQPVRGFLPEGAAPPIKTNEPLPASGFKGGINVRGIEASLGERAPEEDIQSHTAEIERLKAIEKNPKATEEEKASARNQRETHEELRDKLQSTESEPVETKIKGITAEEPKVRTRRETLPPVEQLYSSEEITDAEGLLASEAGAMATADRPGVYFDENPENQFTPQRQQSASRGITSGGRWRGLRSGREMYPFMREHPEMNPDAVLKALRNKDSAAYKKAVGAAVEFIRQEQEGERAAIQAEGEAETAGEPIFPGMGRAVAEQGLGAARVKAEEMTHQLGRPLGSIDAAAGEMERKSPLFRGTAASPQGELLGSTPLSQTPTMAAPEEPTARTKKKRQGEKGEPE